MGSQSIIALINGLSANALLFAIVLVFIKYLKTRQNHIGILAFALFLLLISTIINILEYSNLAPRAENFEDILGILFLPILIFSIHSIIIQRELASRKKSENKFKGILNQTFSFIGVLNPEGEYIEINSTALEFGGYKNGELTGVHFSKSNWWNHSILEQEKIIKAIEEAKTGRTVRFETSQIDIFGKVHYVDFSLKPYYDENGSIIYLISEGRDITEIRLAKIELEQHKNHLEELVNIRTQELTDANKEISDINKQLFQKNKEIEQTNADLISHKDQLEKTLKELQVTQNQLIESEKMASLGVLTAGVAHEINNPLNYILGGYTGLEHFFSDNKVDDKNVKILMQNIKAGIDKAASIVSGLNQFSRNKDSLNEPCNIHEIIDNCLLMLNNQLKSKVTLEKHYTDKTCIIYGNSRKLHQVFLNVLLNACQWIEIYGTIRIVTEIKDNWLLITIIDTGIGISKDILNKIIEPFFTTKEPGQGTGLGLSITYTIIKDHQGTLEFESEQNIGTTVKIKLPVNLNKI